MSHFWPAGLFESFSGVSARSAVLLLCLPRAANRPGLSLEATPGISKHLAVAGLVGAFLYFIAQGAVWSYFERMGSASGIDPNIIGEAMGLSSFAGVGGAFLAVLLVSRCGRRWPLIASGILSVASFWLLRGQINGTELIVSGLLFNFAWNLAQPLLSGVCSDADCHGRVVVAMGCIQTVGFGIGPALTATLLRGHDYGLALWSSAAVLVVSLIVVLTGMRAHTRSVPAAV